MARGDTAGILAGFRMVADPQYAVRLLEELDEEFPTGMETMGHFERALYHLATQVGE